jgi:hypothetical protein
MALKIAQWPGRELQPGSTGLSPMTKSNQSKEDKQMENTLSQRAKIIQALHAAGAQVEQAHYLLEMDGIEHGQLILIEAELKQLEKAVRSFRYAYNDARYYHPEEYLAQPDSDS